MLQSEFMKNCSIGVHRSTLMKSKWYFHMSDGEGIFKCLKTKHNSSNLITSIALIDLQMNSLALLKIIKSSDVVEFLLVTFHYHFL